MTHMPAKLALRASLPVRTILLTVFRTKKARRTARRTTPFVDRQHRCPLPRPYGKLSIVVHAEDAAAAYKVYH